MRHSKLIILHVIVVGLMSACSTQKKLTKHSSYNQSYINYLSSVINDTTFFEIPELKIVDSSIYPIMDSLIIWSENCSYYDSRLKNLYSFRFAAFIKNEKLLYSMNAHMSPATAISLLLVKAGLEKQVENIGIFYYKHHLFVVPMEDYRDQKDLEYFPFVMRTGDKLKIRAPFFLDEKDYSSYISFSLVNGFYTIKENEICGLQILLD